MTEKRERTDYQTEVVSVYSTGCATRRRHRRSLAPGVWFVDVGLTTVVPHTQTEAAALQQAKWRRKDNLHG